MFQYEAPDKMFVILIKSKPKLAFRLGQARIQPDASRTFSGHSIN